MGARTNFTCVTDTGSLTLYSHWGGDTKFEDLAVALSKAMPRIKMGDTSYALRIAISYLINDSWDSETGFGLFVGPEGGEEQYEPVEVNFTSGTVTHSGSSHTIDEYVQYFAGAAV